MSDWCLAPSLTRSIFLSVRNLATISALSGVGGQQRVISANAAVEEARRLIEEALAEQGTRSEPQHCILWRPR
jgi:hypothetical protein